MNRISLILSEIYHKFLPIAERSGITINLSCSDPSIQVDNPEQLVADLEQSLNDTLSRTSASEIQISVDRQAITITDPETVLSHTACALLSRSFLTVDSRVGFGTTISIALKRPTEAAGSLENPGESTITSEISLEAVETSTNSLAPKDPTPAPKPAKSASKSPKTTPSRSKSTKTSRKNTTKPTKTDRQLARAAKKADRKVKKLAKKAKKAKQRN